MISFKGAVFMGQGPKSDFNKMVTALGLNVSNVSLAAAFDAAVQFIASRFAGAERGKLGEEPVGSTSLTWDRAPEWRARRVQARRSRQPAAKETSDAAIRLVIEA